jgi:hypothetical protein
MSDVKQRALELVESVNKQILEAREDLMKQMVEKNLLPDDYLICDNMLDIVEGTTLQYKCWAAARPKKGK